METPKKKPGAVAAAYRARDSFTKYAEKHTPNCLRRQYAAAAYDMHEAYMEICSVQAIVAPMEVCSAISRFLDAYCAFANAQREKRYDDAVAPFDDALESLAFVIHHNHQITVYGRRASCH